MREELNAKNTELDRREVQSEEALANQSTELERLRNELASVHSSQKDIEEEAEEKIKKLVTEIEQLRDEATNRAAAMETSRREYEEKMAEHGRLENAMADLAAQHAIVGTDREQPRHVIAEAVDETTVKEMAQTTQRYNQENRLEPGLQRLRKNISQPNNAQRITQFEFDGLVRPATMQLGLNGESDQSFTITLFFYEQGRLAKTDTLHLISSDTSRLLIVLYKYRQKFSRAKQTLTLYDSKLRAVPISQCLQAARRDGTNAILMSVERLPNTSKFRASVKEMMALSRDDTLDATEASPDLEQSENLPDGRAEGRVMACISEAEALGTEYLETETGHTERKSARRA